MLRRIPGAVEILDLCLNCAETKWQGGPRPPERTNGGHGLQSRKKGLQAVVREQETAASR